MAKETTQDEKFVGIVPIEPDWSQYALERLGPPPGNAEILIRGGAGWVFGIAPREEILDPRITELGTPPHPDDVALALAQEMAWRWFYGHEPFVPEKQKDLRAPSKKGQLPRRYEDAEKGFVIQMLNLARGMGFVAPLNVTQVGEVEHVFSSICACSKAGTCCTPIDCQSCQEE